LKKSCSIIRENIKLLSNKESPENNSNSNIDLSSYNDKIIKAISQSDENSNNFLLKKLKELIEKLINELSDTIKTNFNDLKDLKNKALIKTEIMLKRSKFNSPNMSQDISIKDTDVSTPETKNFPSNSTNLNYNELLSEINKMKSYLKEELAKLNEDYKK
jgi:hypothetical protein